MARGLERERLLRADIENLKAAAGRRSSELDRAAKQAEQLHAAAELRATFEKRRIRKDSEAAMLDAEVARLQAETSTLREALKGRESAVEALKSKLESLKALPEIAAVVAEDSHASGQPETVYSHLLERLDKLVPELLFSEETLQIIKDLRVLSSGQGIERICFLSS